jgi:general secretion pathway protein F
MPVFEYKALDSQGKSRRGIIDAESETGARSRIRALGQYPVEVRETTSRKKKSSKKISPVFSFFDNVPPREVADFTRQLATLLQAGIPLVQALGSLAVQTRNIVLKRIVTEIKESVNEGSSLANAMSGYAKIFSNVYVNMVKAGETSGSLDIVLARLADFAEKEEAVKARLMTAMIYPTVMAVVGTGILLFLITYIVPSITKVFADMKQVLPLPTIILLALSDFMKNWWWLVVLFLVFGLVVFKFVLRTKGGRSLMDLYKLKIPIAGPVLQKILMARIASTLASLLESGVGLIPALQIVRNILDNVHVNAVIDETIEQIRQGRSMTQSLGASLWFPPIFVQMVAVGEQSGDLGPMLNKVAEAYERDVEIAVNRMTALVEPLMILIMGAGVLFVVLSILLPIFEMNQMIK